MSIELIRNQRDKNSGELYATPPNGKCPIGNLILKHSQGALASHCENVNKSSYGMKLRSLHKILHIILCFSSLLFVIKYIKNQLDHLECLKGMYKWHNWMTKITIQLESEWFYMQSWAITNATNSPVLWWSTSATRARYFIFINLGLVNPYK